ncbi:type I methionyl aminopeptidase [Candidatus Saccharibacteria bacterium]|jgi:methionyl aminopeptidase|nr:type I methionyl aminopeptidase [Candidatus Saccharibacteria bacterium]
MSIITGRKTPQQIEAMREGGRILAQIFQDIKDYVKPGLTGLEVNDFVADKISEYGATPTYREPMPDFPGVVCISVNDAIVHGVPNDYELENGDIVSFDLVITYKSMKTDSAFTMVVGEEPKGAVKHLLKATEQSLYAGIDAIKGDGTTTNDIGSAIELVLKKAKLGIIRELVGHGVGLEMHMPPDVPNFRIRGLGVSLQAGDTIAIEPMATLGGERTKTDASDGWTIRTKDGSLAAHFEHTVLITKDGAEILTKL